MAKTAKGLLAALERAQDKCESAKEDLEAFLHYKIDFDFSIFYQPSDGFVVVDEVDSRNAPLSKILGVIKRKGICTFDDYMDHAI